MNGNTALKSEDFENSSDSASGLHPQCALPGVLVVESNPDLQWRIARMLTVRGHRVVGTSSGEGALALVRQWPVDVVLTDYHLPGMGGDELIKALRVERPELPAVFMVQHDDEDLSRDLPADAAIIHKPFSADDLAVMVDRVSSDG